MDGSGSRNSEGLRATRVHSAVSSSHQRPSAPRPSHLLTPTKGSRNSSFQLPLNSVPPQPTTSVNLDQTICQVSASPISLTPVATPIGMTPNSTINRQAVSEDPLSGSGVYEDEDDALMESMNQSIYSNVESTRRNFPFVSVDVPTVFVDRKPTSSEDLELCKWDKNFFILSSAGKPIYSMHGKEEQIVSFMGILNTIINYFQLENSTDIKTIESMGQKFVFLDRSPIFLVAYSLRGETSNELVNQLDFLHSYLLSSLSQRQVLRIFDKRENFDLRNFLELTDFENLDEICSLISEKFYPDVLLGALQCLTLNKSYRSQLHDSMLQNLLKQSDLPRGTLLYGLIVAPNNRLCSVLRPRGHTLHTTDLHLLFCLVFHQFQNSSDNQELWVPICFPKFNSNGFLYCYIKFLSSPSQKQKESKRPALVLISAQKSAFYQLKSLGDKLVANIQSNGLLDKIYQSRPIRIGDIQATWVHHFVYKSKKHVQYVMPELQYSNREPDPEQEQEYEKKLMTYYQQIHNSVINDEGVPFNDSTLNFTQWEGSIGPFEEPNYNGFIQGEKTQVLGLAWISPSFELYLISNNGVNDKKVIMKSAKKIITWCRKNHSRLFVSEGATF